VAGETQVFGKRARFAEPALVDGAVGVVVAPRGRLALALAVTVSGEQVAGYEVIADPARLAALHISLF
jgi:RNA polymerase sigma-70 factor (ECF subfamily)